LILNTLFDCSITIKQWDAEPPRYPKGIGDKGLEGPTPEYNILFSKPDWTLYDLLSMWLCFRLRFVDSGVC